jgi:hypothetical protein
MVFSEISNVSSYRKLLPDHEEGDFQGFANNEVNKSEINKLVF